MTISSNYSFDLNRDQIITRALNLVGLGSAQTPSQADIAMAGDFFNVIIKELQAKKGSPLLTTIDRTTVPIVQGGTSISLDADTIDVEEPIMLVPSGGLGELRLTMIARAEYQMYSDKVTQGRPLRAYVERGSPCKILLLPIPDGTYPTLRYTRIRLLRDMEAGSTADLPSRWLRHLIMSLAHDMALARNMNAVQVAYLGKQAKDSFAELKMDDRQPAPSRMVVRHRGRYSW